jgi:hypothetical protein
VFRVLAMVAGALAAGPANASAWPRVVPQTGSAEIEQVPEHGVQWALRDANGRTAYELTCKTGDSGDGEDFDYSGFIHCRLDTPGRKAWPPSLLMPADSTRTWQGRARFMLGDVVAACGQVPDYGATRSFRLRGMQLRLTVDRLDVDPGAPPFYVRRFRLAYDVRPDATATAATPARVAPEPAWFNRKGCQAEVLGQHRAAPAR